MDAAIAASAALSIIYPHMTGLGGDAFWLIYDAKQNSVCYLDGAGCAAASASIKTFRARYAGANGGFFTEADFHAQRA